MLWLLHRARSISITLRVISSLLHNINFNFSGSNYIDLSLSHQSYSRNDVLQASLQSVAQHPVRPGHLVFVCVHFVMNTYQIPDIAKAINLCLESRGRDGR